MWRTLPDLPSRPAVTRGWHRGLCAAACVAALAYPTLATSQTRLDADTPEANAVVSLSACTGTLITPRVVLTAAHCVPAQMRVPPPSPGNAERCAKLPDQHQLAQSPHEDPERWNRFPGEARPIARIGPDSAQRRLGFAAEAYNLPRCADIALLRLEQEVPTSVARSLPILLPENRGQALPWRDLRLRHAGWGAQRGEGRPLPTRQTGPVRAWAENACALFGLPPVRENGERVLTGDSGSPLLATLESLDGPKDYVIALLFARGTPDPETCGAPSLRVPQRHGTYLPLWRGPLTETGATDLRAWLVHHVPEAVWLWSPEDLPRKLD